MNLLEHVKLKFFNADGDETPSFRFDAQTSIYAGDGSAIRANYPEVSIASFAVVECDQTGALIKGVMGNVPRDMQQRAISGEGCSALCFAELSTFGRQIPSIPCNQEAIVSNQNSSAPIFLVDCAAVLVAAGDPVRASGPKANQARIWTKLLTGKHLTRQECDDGDQAHHNRFT